MAVVVHDLHPVHLILFNPHSISSTRAQSNSVSDDIKAFHALSWFDQPRVEFEGSLHDSVREIGVRERIPVILLVCSANDRPATYAGLASNADTRRWPDTKADDSPAALGKI